MRGYWSETRPNGQPVEPGTVCWITDLEDGTNPIATYGKDQSEVLEKLARQNANAQLALARRSTPRTTTTAQPVRAISPEEVMQATADLDNPAKAGKAIATLVESETGLDLTQMILRQFVATATEWEHETPDFYLHPGNQRMLTQEATGLAGGKLGNVTKEHLTRAFHNLQARGELFEAPPPREDQPSTPSSFPGETQVQRTDGTGRRFATSARSTTFRSQTPVRQLKYTEEQIRRMPLSKSRQLIESGDRDYAEACDYFFGQKALQ